MGCAGGFQRGDDQLVRTGTRYDSIVVSLLFAMCCVVWYHYQYDCATFFYDGYDDGTNRRNNRSAIPCNTRSTSTFNNSTVIQVIMIQYGSRAYG